MTGFIRDISHGAGTLGMATHMLDTCHSRSGPIPTAKASKLLKRKFFTTASVFTKLMKTNIQTITHNLKILDTV